MGLARSFKLMALTCQRMSVLLQGQPLKMDRSTCRMGFAVAYARAATSLIRCQG
jgi:hypothetical protein